MKQYISREWIRKNGVILTLIVITIVGAFLRLYLMPGGMHYELDQARDYRVIDHAITYGPGELPLQGPKAAGNVVIAPSDEPGYGGKTTLRLGPLFYYIEYVSALVFGNSPFGSIVFIILLSIATIPLFYFFVREFFKEKLSLGLVALFAASLFFVTYSRFGWNPNLMPFFALLTALCLLKLTKPEMTSRRRGLYLLGASASFAFLSNMHFLAFTIFPVIAIAYLLWTRPHIALKYWIGAIAVFLFLNIPLIVNDVKTGGENARAFIASVQGESDDTSLKVAVVENSLLHAQYFWIVATGDQMTKFPDVRRSQIVCEQVCKGSLLQSFVAVATLAASIGALFWFLRYEKNIRRKNFLRMTFLWLGVTFLVYTPLAGDAAPRFFLLQAPLFIVLLGFIIEAGLRRGKKRDYFLGNLVIIFFVGTNLLMNVSQYSEIRVAQVDPLFELAHSDHILGEKTRVTFAQMEAAAQIIQVIHEKNDFPVFIHGQSEHKRALWERVDVRDIPREHIPLSLEPIYREGNYFVLVRAQSNQLAFLEKFAPAFTLINTYNFGTLNLYHLSQRDEAITAENYPLSTMVRDPRFSDSAQPRYLWRQVFSGCRYSYATDLCE